MITAYIPHVSTALPIETSVKIDQHMKAINDLLEGAGYKSLGELELKFPNELSYCAMTLRWQGYQ